MAAADFIYELTRGLAYRKIDHAHQRMYTTVFPLCLAVALTICYALIPEKTPLLGKDGLLSAALSILSTLPGFYFAGLAAVATFGSADMEKDMPDPAPHLRIRHKGVMVDSKLSRRKYLSYLFSYLVLVSFALCGAIVFLNLVQPTIVVWQTDIVEWRFGQLILQLMEIGVVFVLVSLAASLVVTTLQGLFFLSERIHQP